MNRVDFQSFDWSSLLHPMQAFSPGIQIGGVPRFSDQSTPAEPRVTQGETPSPTHAVFVPEHYEPNYAYPLIVWLHGPGGSEQELRTVMPQISTRNYFGISLRGTVPATSGFPVGFNWSRCLKHVSIVEAELHEAVRRLRRRYHIHSERIFLAGFDTGGTLALELTLLHPEWFAGAVTFGGRFPSIPNPLRRYHGLQGKRLLLGNGLRVRKGAMSETGKIGRLLHVAGMEVTTRVYDAGHEVVREMLLDVDRWLMEAICHPEPA